jgi:hypothetical protein
MYKECIECLEIKNIEDFVVKRNLCKNCMKEYKKSYHIKQIYANIPRNRRKI